MHIIDISWPLTTNTTAYKDKKVIEFYHTKLFEADAVRESKIMLGSHSGTHIDAPAHFLRDGHTIEHLPLSCTIGPCKLLDLSTVTHFITADDLKKFEINKHDIVLLKTKNSSLEPTAPFDYEFVYLDATGARYLADKQIKCVGIDYLGIERQQPDHETHTVLMQSSIVIIEGLRLGHVPGGSYFLVCLPLYTIGLEAAAARAVLLDDF